jgi:hypothetical protein
LELELLGHRSEGWTAAWEMDMWLAGKSPMNIGKIDKHGWKWGIFIDKHWFIIYEIWLWKICDNHGKLWKTPPPKTEVLHGL